MSRLEQRLIDSHDAAKQQRERLKSRITATRDRLTPQRLVVDARVEAEQQIRATASDIASEVRAHPVRTGLLGAALLAWVFRHPLIDHGPAWVKRAYALVSGRQAAVDDDDDDEFNEDLTAGNGDETVSTTPDDREPCPDGIVQQNDSHG